MKLQAIELKPIHTFEKHLYRILKFVVFEWLISYLFQVLNLFLALLLSSFGASNLSGANGDEDGTNKLTEAFNRIGRFKRRGKKLIVKGLTIIKDKILECFRKGLSLERGKTIKQKNLVSYCPSLFKSVSFSNLLNIQSLGNCEKMRHFIFIWNKKGHLPLKRL